MWQIFCLQEKLVGFEPRTIQFIVWLKDHFMHGLYGSTAASDGLVEYAENYKRWPRPTTERAGSTSGQPQEKISGIKHLVASCQTNIFHRTICTKF